MFLASPEVVFQELKKHSERAKGELLGRDDRLETVLVKRNQHWIWPLYDLLDTLAREQVAIPDKIDHVLARWATLDDRSDGKPIEGRFTSLPIKDEFRCLVAALYGRGFVNNAFVLHGSANAKDVALRCAYYGKGDITPNEMKAGYKRDKEVFAEFAGY
ncbi:MAG: hypothetical protein FJX44_03360 [Alphaproteobacteria bacterium]|nr:hypothetical protein [Alphaproteobacteria bacterium]